MKILSFLGGLSVLFLSFLGGSELYKRNGTYKECYDTVHDKVEAKIKEKKTS